MRNEEFQKKLDDRANEMRKTVEFKKLKKE